MARSNSALALSPASRHSCAARIRVPAVLAVHHKVAPARMERNIERRIGGARDLDHQVGGGIELARIDTEMIELAIQPQRQQPVGALAHRRGAQKRKGCCRRGPHGI